MNTLFRKYASKSVKERYLPKLAEGTVGVDLCVWAD